MSFYNKVIDLQKLNIAWNHVRANKPAKGVDGITWDMFDADKKVYLKELHLELAEHKYKPLPVKRVTLYKGEKAREVMLYSMRDKVVAQSLADELTKLYDALLPDCCYAYRPGRSALNAVESISDNSSNEEYSTFVKTDIEHFFDNIPYNRLEEILRKKIPEDDVLDLIRDSVTTQILSENGDLIVKRIGIHQGSSLSPILSNIYLMELDENMGLSGDLYYRYADDILILSKEHEKGIEMLNELKNRIEAMALRLNATKTLTGDIANGFDYLGYHFDRSGKAIPAKAEESLTERLEGVWLSEKSSSVTELLKKCAEIVNGWEQYFRGDREPASVYEYAAVLYMTHNRNYDGADTFFENRKKYHNNDKRLLKWMVSVWKDVKNKLLAVYEYEDYYELADADTAITLGEVAIDEALSIYDQQIVNETKENWESLMQLYSDSGCYNRALLAEEHLRRFEEREKRKSRPVLAYLPEEETGDMPIVLKEAELDSFMDTFVGREDIYSEEFLMNNRTRKCEQVMQPLSAEVIKSHLLGNRTIDTFVQRANSTTRFLVIDVDISKKILMSEKGRSGLVPYLQKAAAVTQDYLKELSRLGLTAYPEDSAHRGFHIWLFFTEWIPTRYVNMLEDVIENRIRLKDDDITVEYFPNKAHVKQGKLGQVVKLPYGIHPLTNKRSYMLDRDLNPIRDPSVFCNNVARFTLNAVKKILGTEELSAEPTHEVDKDISAYGNLPENIAIVLNNCNLMRHLCLKAVKTGFLPHLDRLMVLYVFGHMGEEGQNFVHQVMKFTVNYKYQTTQYFISRQKGKPISCLKLRDTYQRLSAEIGCNCAFKRSKECYPSPVLHALRESTEDSLAGITIPTSKTLSKESTEAVLDEMNTGQKVKDIAQKILSLKKQKRSLEKSIGKLESQLEKIYDDAHVESLECDIGILTRRKKDDGTYEWLIEL
ncbi:MAG: hypothetical protein K6E85_16935 [Lachnospiraceae bacterium]|nr:hypothetical protein [Lachnospiraceae bacterium]